MQAPALCGGENYTVRTNSRKTLWRKLLFGYAIPLALVIGLIIYLKVVSRDEPSALLENASFLIASIAAIFVVVSVLIARRSLEKTEEALELTWNTTRPFLNVLEPVHASVVWATIKDPHQSDIKTIPSGESCIGNITVAICNTGVFPADEVAVDCAVSRNKKNAKKHDLILDKANPSVYFPGGEITHVFRETPGRQKLALKRSDVLRTLITISYKNKLTQKKHKTVRSYLLKCDPTAQSIIPFPEEDYWD